MNWAFLLVALVGGIFPLAMIAWVLLLAPTGDRATDLERERRRIALGAACERTFDAGRSAVRKLAQVRISRKA